MMINLMHIICTLPTSTYSDPNGASIYQSKQPEGSYYFCPPQVFGQHYFLLICRVRIYFCCCFEVFNFSRKKVKILLREKQIFYSILATVFFDHLAQFFRFKSRFQFLILCCQAVVQLARYLLSSKINSKLEIH